jgi:hypothetical protein
VLDAVWVQAGVPPEAILCVGCLERRLGCQLGPEDFPDLPVNVPHPWDTVRLASRKTGLPESVLAGRWPP